MSLSFGKVIGQVKELNAVKLPARVGGLLFAGSLPVLQATAADEVTPGSSVDAQPHLRRPVDLVSIPNLSRNDTPFQYKGSFPVTSSSQLVNSSSESKISLSPSSKTPVAREDGFFRRVFSWIDDRLGGPTSWVANVIQIASGIGGLWMAVHALRSYRLNPRLLTAESVFLKPNAKPGFINAGQKKTREVFDDWLERFVVFSAARKATPEFPMLFINTDRYPEIAALMRADLTSIDADTTISALGMLPTQYSHLREWHLIIVPRKAWIGKTPVIQRDFFTYSSFVEMLDRPLEIFRDLKGLKQELVLNHMEEAALVTHLQRNILVRAIKEAYPNKAQDQSWIDKHANKLSANANALLRLIMLSTDESLVMLTEAAKTGSLSKLQAVASDADIQELIDQRINRTTLFEKFLEPILHFVWKDTCGLVSSKARGRSSAADLGLYDCFSVGHMTSVDRCNM